MDVIILMLVVMVIVLLVSTIGSWRGYRGIVAPQRGRLMLVCTAVLVVIVLVMMIVG